MNSEYRNKIKSGLVDENGIIKLEFIRNDGYPQILVSEMCKGTPRLSTHQAKTFYAAVNRIYLSTVASRLSMDEAIVELTMLSSRMNDKFNKGLIPEEFKEFIELNIDAVNDIKTLKAFVLHFEAICNNLKEGNKPSNNKPNNKPSTQKPNGVKNNNGGNNRW